MMYQHLVCRICLPGLVEYAHGAVFKPFFVGSRENRNKSPQILMVN
jgi:hypothetical protein